MTTAARDDDRSSEAEHRTPTAPLSAVSHVVEPLELLRDAGHDVAWAAVGGVSGWNTGSKFVPCGLDGATLAALRDPAARLEWQGLAGLSGEVLHASTVLWAELTAQDRAASDKLVDVYNDWLADFTLAARDRLIPIGQIPVTRGASGAADELRACAARGFPGVHLRTLPNGGSKCHDDDDVFWSAAEEEGIVVSMDETFGPTSLSVDWPDYGVPSAAEVLHLLVYAGVFDRYPGLRVTVSCSSASWIPYWLERGDDIFQRAVGKWRNIPLNLERVGALPSDYLRERLWFACSSADTLLARFPEYVPAERLLWASHFPSPFSLGATQDTDGLVAGLNEESAERVLQGNCHALYRERAAVPPPPALPVLAHAIG